MSISVNAVCYFVILILLCSCSTQTPVRPFNGGTVELQEIADLVGSQTAFDVSPELVGVARGAVRTLFSDQVEVLSDWPEVIRGNPPRGPYKSLTAQSLAGIGQPNVVIVTLVEDGSGDARSFCVLWDVELNRAIEIKIKVR